jgi:hypothetical protein
MDPLADIRTLVTVGGVFASLAGAWFLMKYQIGELRDSDTGQIETMKAIGAKMDEVRIKVDLQEQRLGVLSGMMKPEVLAEHYKETTRFQTATEKDLVYLRRDVDELRKAGAI